MINLTIINFSQQIPHTITTHETVFWKPRKFSTLFFWVKNFKRRRRRRKPTTSSLFVSPLIILCITLNRFVLFCLFSGVVVGWLFFFSNYYYYFLGEREGVFLLRVNGRLTVLILLVEFFLLSCVSKKHWVDREWYKKIGNDILRRLICLSENV